MRAFATKSSRKCNANSAPTDDLNVSRISAILRARRLRASIAPAYLPVSPRPFGEPSPPPLPLPLLPLPVEGLGSGGLSGSGEGSGSGGLSGPGDGSGAFVALVLVALLVSSDPVVRQSLPTWNLPDSRCCPVTNGIARPFLSCFMAAELTRAGRLTPPPGVATI